jgi:hypothetical protein
MIVTANDLHRIYGAGEAEVRALDGVDVNIDERYPPAVESAT